jgi:hypothetical protein
LALAFLRLPLSQSHAGTPAVLVDEFDPLFVGWKFFERVDNRQIHRCKMALVAREDCEVMPMGRRSDCDIGKARRMTTAARKIGQGTGYLRCRAVEGQHAIAL